MCGIAYQHNFDGTPVNNDVMQQFDLQRHRGLEGFGLFDGQEMNMVHAAKEDRILRWLVKYDSNLILFHHRNPTSTINIKRTAHPFTTHKFFGKNQYILVHNGHVNNSRILRTEHEKLGIKYQSKLRDGTFNDSESLLWDFALTMEGKQDGLRASGGIAFICLKIVDGVLDKMYFARNTSPLNLFRDENGVRLSSEGKGKPIDPHMLYTYNYVLNRLTTRFFDVPPHYKYENTGNSTKYIGAGNGYNASGNYVPPYLRAVENEIDKRQSTMPYQDVLDYDRDGNPIYDSYDDDYTPTMKEVEVKVLDLLCDANGVFEVAYWAAEQKMEAAMEFGDTYEVWLLEAAMEYIENDPENVDKNSVSTMWEAIWER